VISGTQSAADPRPIRLSASGKEPRLYVGRSNTRLRAADALPKPKWVLQVVGYPGTNVQRPGGASCRPMSYSRR
jgi:hypothetical protein